MKTKMEVKQELLEFSEETIIKPEPGFMDPKTAVKVEQYEWNSENPQISPTQPFPASTIKVEPQDGSSFSPHIDNVREVKASDFLVNISDLVNVKQEIAELDVPKTEFLTTVCDLPSLKTDTLEYFDQPCSSSQAQQLLLSQSNKKGAVKKIVKKNRRRYPCPVCNKNYFSNSLRKKHTIQHFKNYVMCFLCGEFFVSFREFSNHCFVHFIKTKRKYIKSETIEISDDSGSEEMHSCRFCYQRFMSSYLFEMHLKKFHSNQSECRYCSYKFKNEFEHLDHLEHIQCEYCSFDIPKCLRIRHIELRHKLNCKICDKTYATKQKLKIHEMTHFENQHQCEICFKIFSTNYSLKCHQKKHANIECENCLKKFNCQQDYKLHVVVCYTLSKTFQCGVCPRKFSSIQYLKIHLSSHNKFPIRCQICLKIFATNESLEAHSKLHSDKNFYECEICLKKFRLKQSLKRHLVSCHDTVQNLQCEICANKYTSEQSFISHLRKHCRFEPLECGMCSKEFDDQQALSAHLATVHDQKLFQCKVCLKQFQTFRSYNTHTNRHEKEKLICKFCEKTFNTKRDLKVHQKSHTQPTFNCTHCARKFKREEVFQRHIRDHATPKYTFSEIPRSKRFGGKNTVENGVLIFTCEVCLIKFKTKEIYEKHILVNRVEQESTCLNCSQPMTLKCHQLIHSLEGFTNQCGLCFAQFISKKSLNDHYQERHQVKRY